MVRDPRIDELEGKIDNLKREYDLYLAGNRRTEPLALRSEVEREVMLLMRFPTVSTVFKFQVKTLAMRFRSLETQIRNLMELRNQRLNIAEQTIKKSDLQDVVVDSMAIENPAIIAARVKSLLSRVGANSSLPADMTAESLALMMINKAKAVVGKGNVHAVRYSLVDSEKGPRVKGETIAAPKLAES